MLCVLWVCGSAVRADLAVGSWAPDIEAKDWKNVDEPVSLYECRGMVVVLFFWSSWSGVGEDVLAAMNFVNSEFGRTQGVFMVGLTETEMSRVREMLVEQRVLFPVGTGSKSAEEYDIESFPRVVVVDTNGKVAWSGWPESFDSLVGEIRRVIADAPPTRTHPIQAAEARRKLTQSRQALREDAFRKAYEAATSAFEHALTGDPLKTGCQDMVDLVEALGRDKYARAEQAIEERDFETAVTLLHEVRGEFRGAEVALSAGQRLRAIKKKYKEVADLVAQRDQSGEAENELYDALELFRARRFGEAYERLGEIVSDYEGTEAADKAQTVMERIRRKPDVMAYVKDHLAGPECRTLLSQARAFLRRGLREQARECCMRVIEEHADTVWADEARRMLARMR